jgi:hypothetical protein
MTKQTDTALLSDESEAELELVDEVGLSLSNAEHPKQPPDLSRCRPPALQPLGLTRCQPPSLQPSNSPILAPRVYDFGCRWDPVNYSCSYDCVFMAFAWVYFHAAEHWRSTWVGQSAAAKTLSRHLKTIVCTVEGPLQNQPTPQIPSLFSRGRDAFRDALSEERPGTFRCLGPVNACLVDILDSLSSGETPSRYFSFISSCGGSRCKLKFLTPAGAPYMLTPSAWASITHSEDPPHHESLQEWASGWFDWKASSLPQSCAGCGASCSLTRSFLHPPWIWFEVFIEQPRVVLPSFELTFLARTYRLAAALYGNGCHFVARLATPSGIWWHYDGQANGG